MLHEVDLCATGTHIRRSPSTVAAMDPESAYSLLSAAVEVSESERPEPRPPETVITATIETTDEHGATLAELGGLI